MILRFPNAADAPNPATKELQFLRFVQDWMRERDCYAFVAGSYATWSFLKHSEHDGFLQRYNFNPADVDVYVTTDDEDDVDDMISEFGHEFDEYRIGHRRSFPAYPGSVMSLFVSKVVEIDIIEPEENEVVTVQVIMMWAGYRPSLFHAAQAILRSYDISACKVAMYLTSSGTSFYFDDGDDALDVLGHRFRFTLRCRERQQTAFKRMRKYFRRGFKMYEFHFESAGFLIPCGDELLPMPPMQ